MPRAVVVTVTLADPGKALMELGLTEQDVALAVREHERLTAEEKPFVEPTETTFVKVAVAPALMVWVVLPEDVMEKSGGPVTVKANGSEVPPGAGSTTYKG